MGSEHVTAVLIVGATHVRHEIEGSPDAKLGLENPLCGCYVVHPLLDVIHDRSTSLFSTLGYKYLLILTFRANFWYRLCRCHCSVSSQLPEAKHALGPTFSSLGSAPVDSYLFPHYLPLPRIPFKSSSGRRAKALPWSWTRPSLLWWWRRKPSSKIWWHSVGWHTSWRWKWHAAGYWEWRSAIVHR